MRRYQILFRGEVLPGFSPMQARLNASRLLKANSTQILQLFSGQEASIRKGLPVADAARYRSSLNRIGLRVHVRLMPVAAPAPVADEASLAGVSFRVVYCGETLEGLARSDVMLCVAQKLQLDQVRLNRLFSGKKAILKKGLSAEAAANYLTEAAQLGMLASMEFDVEPTAAKPSIRKTQRVTQSAPQISAEEVEKRFMQSAIKTQLREPTTPIYTPHIEAAQPNDTSTVVDIDLSRLVFDDTFEMPGPMLKPIEPVKRIKLAPPMESPEPPMPEVKVWRALSPEFAGTGLSASGPEPQPESRGVDTHVFSEGAPWRNGSNGVSALRSVELHASPAAPKNHEKSSKRKHALQRLVVMGSLLPKKLVRLFH